MLVSDLKEFSKLDIIFMLDSHLKIANCAVDTIDLVSVMLITN